ALEAGDAAPPVANLTDDEPAPVEEWLPALAAALGAGAPFRLPRWAAWVLESGDQRELFEVSVRMSNRLARATLGFRPRFPSYREGFTTLGGAGRG
ncbi:MAG: NAD(P)-dependent oxidoreductase, partial [Chloroflexi bacterium]|nr:NAD(P)-dependent oxidoreductase [Chloroflexota bacterium]